MHHLTLRAFFPPEGPAPTRAPQFARGRSKERECLWPISQGVMSTYHIRRTGAGRSAMPDGPGRPHLFSQLTPWREFGSNQEQAFATNRRLLVGVRFVGWRMYGGA